MPERNTLGAMFDWLKKKRRWAPELVFASRGALLQRLESLIDGEAGTPVLVCAFELSLSSLEAELSSRSCARATSAASLSERLEGYRLGLPLPTATTGVIEGASALGGPARPAHFLVVERHPLRVHDDAIEAFAERLANGSRVTFLLSLDDPFFARIGGNLKELMAKLGVGDEALENALLSKAIAGFQAKLARAVPHEVPARSAEEWYAANVR